MGAIQRKSLYRVQVTENKGRGWIFEEYEYHNTVTEYVIADNENEARGLAIKSLLASRLIDDVKKIIGVSIECERDRVVTGIQNG